MEVYFEKSTYKNSNRKTKNFTPLGDIIHTLEDLVSSLEKLKMAEFQTLLENGKLRFAGGRIDFNTVIRELEFHLIKHALKKANGSQTEAAKMLNLKLTTLNAKIKRLGICL